MERRTLWLTAGFAAGLLFVGIPYWSLPYNADYLADPNLRLGLLALALITTCSPGLPSPGRSSCSGSCSQSSRW